MGKIASIELTEQKSNGTLFEKEIPQYKEISFLFSDNIITDIMTKCFASNMGKARNNKGLH